MSDTYLEIWEAVEAGVVLNISTGDIETGSVPGTSNTAIAKATLGEGGSIVSALCTHSRPSSVLMD